jgi:Zn-finger nucleic acid-binding protein
MDEARTYSCPHCGGKVDEEARRCPFCSAPVATVRCAACYHMNAASSVHCSGCGRELGLEPIGESDALACPHCKEPFSAFRSEHGALHDCSLCGGQFVEHALLVELLERREVYGAAPRSERHAPPPANEPVRYVPCPSCGAMMNRKNFGGTSGVIVDVCRKHGVWFDAGELPRVLAFAESGGLARARQRELRELEDARRDAAVASVRAAAAGGAGAHLPGEYRPEHTDVRELGAALEEGVIAFYRFLKER